MHPILFQVGDFEVPSYLVAGGLGYLLALFIAMRLASSPAGQKDGLKTGQVWDLFIVLTVASIIGAKLGHVFFEADGHIGSHGQAIHTVWELLKDDPWHWARLTGPGYVWYGGMIGCLIAAVVYFRRRPELSRWDYADVFAVATLFGASVGRVGCFMAGCCHGAPTDVPWAVQFVTTHEPVHPTQAYDSLSALVVGSLLYYRHARRRFSGELVLGLLVGYPVLRSFTEIFRGDAERGFVGPLSTSQFISIPLFLIGLGIGWWRSRKAKSDKVSTTGA